MPGGAVCPGCGVPVVPGYVRCPKCHKALPKARAITTPAEGGTAVERAKSPLVVIGIGVVVVGVIAYVALHGRGDKATAAPGPGSAQPGETAPAPATDTGAQGAPAAGVADPTAAARAPRTADPATVAAGLERTLQRQRLWSTVEVIGGRADVRGGSCGDPAMAPMLDTAARAFKAAGLTKLRCLEQSGHVVVDRDL